MFPLLTLAKAICTLFHLTYMNLNWIDAQKTNQGAPYPCAAVEGQLSPQTLRFIKRSSLPS